MSATSQPFLAKTNQLIYSSVRRGFPGISDGKESACNEGDPGSIPGSGRSSGEGNGHPLQYSCLENFMDRGAWWATVYGVANTVLGMQQALINMSS